MRNGVFDTTRVKKLSEKRLIPGDCKIKYIMPLVSIDGLLYLTDERIYMQPLHPQILEKPVINLKVASIKELFKRRYTLMDIGLEVVAHSQDGDIVKKKTMYIVFQGRGERDFVYEKLLSIVAKDCVTTERNLQEYTQQWCNS